MYYDFAIVEQQKRLIKNGYCEQINYTQRSSRTKVEISNL